MKVNLLERKGYDSVNLFNEILIQESGTLNKMQKGLQWVKDNNLDCTLIGGTAVAHYLPSARALSPDFDFLVPEYNKLKSLLTKQSISFSSLAQSDGMSELGIAVPSFDIDFLDVNSGDKAIKKYAIRTAETGNIGGVQLKIISPEVYFNAEELKAILIKNEEYEKIIELEQYHKQIKDYIFAHFVKLNRVSDRCLEDAFQIIVEEGIEIKECFKNQESK